jgi:predicted TIM-barrel fold metal-dependent hydrolase
MLLADPLVEALKTLPTPLPEGSCDCHFHLFGDATNYPTIENPSYIPEPATLLEQQRLMQSIGVDRSVFVQPSIYGSDHRLFEETLRHVGMKAMRGVAVANPETSEKTLENWQALGVRGTRYNALFAGGISLNALYEVSAKASALDWHLQLLVDISKKPNLVGDICTTGLPIVVDHFGHPDLNDKAWETGFANLLALVKEGQVWVKLSAPYRLGLQGQGEEPIVLALVERLMKANPERLVWGSDWPHPPMPGEKYNKNKQTDSFGLLKLLAQKLSRHEFEQILVGNPQHLYWGNK